MIESIPFEHYAVCVESEGDVLPVLVMERTVPICCQIDILVVEGDPYSRSYAGGYMPLRGGQFIYRGYPLCRLRGQNRSSRRVPQAIDEINPRKTLYLAPADKGLARSRLRPLFTLDSGARKEHEHRYLTRFKGFRPGRRMATVFFLGCWNRTSPPGM